MAACRGKATDSVRSDIFFSGALTPATNTRHRAERDSRNGSGDAHADEGDNDHPTTPGGRNIDGVVCAEGCNSFISGSNTMLCKERTPMVALIKIRWAAVSATIGRCGTTARMKKSTR